MLEKKNIHDVSSQIRTIYNKGVEAANKNNPDYAIDLLKTVVNMEPGFLSARKKLRSLEKDKLSAKPIKKLFRLLKVKKFIKIGQLNLVRKKYKDAYAAVEEALAIDVKNLSALNLLAEVAKALEAPFIVIETYELAQEFYPENIDVLRKLANAYRDNKMGVMELRIRQKLIKIFPDDLQVRAELRSASAAATLEKHDAEDIDVSHNIGKFKNIDETEILEQKERIVHSADNVQKLIGKYEADLVDDPDSITLLRKLGELYQKSGIHGKAFEYFKKFEEVNDIFDTTIDQSMEKSELALIENEINGLSKDIKDSSAKAAVTEKIIQLKRQLDDTRQAYALKRVKLYPNNLILRFSLAVIHWEQKEYDLAIEQFQLSQENLQYHISSLLFLGRCFLCKKQFDIAIEQFKKVVVESSTMTKQKMEALYYLGIAYENMNDSLNAMGCFKEIYSTQSTYKDIAMRVQK